MMINLFLLSSVAVYRAISQVQPIRISGPIHGSMDGGIFYQFQCPRNGVITGMNVRSGLKIDQIRFVCTSSIGQEIFGPYGGDGGSPHGFNCQNGEYISSIFGRSGSYVDQIGIRCRNPDDMNDWGHEIDAWGGGGGVDFDDLYYSIGFRPETIQIRAGGFVDAIRIIYVNTRPSIDPCTNCTSYEEIWANKHGGDGGGMHSFNCRDEGVITGIKIRSGNRVDSIQFTCKSRVSETTQGPFGGDGGTSYVQDCPPGFFIGSILGRSGVALDNLAIRCVRPYQDGGPPLDGHGGEGGSPFDDDSYARNLKRPVEIVVWSGTKVDAIQIKYGNLPVDFYLG